MTKMALGASGHTSWRTLLVMSQVALHFHNLLGVQTELSGFAPMQWSCRGNAKTLTCFVSSPTGALALHVSDCKEHQLFLMSVMHVMQDNGLLTL